MQQYSAEHAPLEARAFQLLNELPRALKSPGLAWPVLNAQLKLRRVTRLPLSVRLWGRAFVINNGEIELGERVRIIGKTVPVELVAHHGARLTIGDGSFLNYGSSISAHSSVTIGDNCLIGNYVNVMDSDYHDLIERDRPGPSAPIIIEDDVWLGTRAIVLKGVRIGKGSAVGAGSVVTRDIPPNSLAFGVPAKVIREIVRP
jgi:maltose O-acetyltransferase